MKKERKGRKGWKRKGRIYRDRYMYPPLMMTAWFNPVAVASVILVNTPDVFL